MTRLLAPILCVLLSGAAEGSQRAIIDTDLRVRPISKLLRLSDSVVEIEDASSSIRRFETSELLGVTQTEERATAPTDGFGWIELVDGQRYVGRIAERASQDESIAWEHQDFGVIWVPLEIVSRVSPGGQAPTYSYESDALNDAVYLQNGDVIEGFLLSAGARFVIERDDGTISESPADLVSLARFANPLIEPRGVYLWMSDGSVFAVESLLDITGERVQISLPTGESAAVRVTEIFGVSFAAERVLPLATLDPERSLPRSRRWAPEATPDPSPRSLESPYLFAPDLALHGAMTLRWSLPADATRFGAVLVMPPRAFPWGDCEVVVRSGGQELQRVRLGVESPRAEIHTELPSSDLEIEVLAGANGSVNDEVLLRAPIVLVGESR